MDILLIILASVCILAGIAGCILPGLPGPPLSYAGLLLLHWSKYAEYTTTLLIILALLVLTITVIDYVFPVYMTKKFGGTKWGIWGATIGLFVGLFFGLPGAIVGPFAGALLGELIGGRGAKSSLKAATGSFIGFLMGVGGKLIISCIVTFYFIQGIWQYWF